MIYTKPEALLLGRAIDAVRMHAKGGNDLDTATPTYSTPAYEVDE